MKYGLSLALFLLMIRAGAQFGFPPIDQLRGGRHVVRSSYDTTGGNNDRINIPAGETAVIFNEGGPGVIQRIWITIDSRDPDFLRKILVRMFWDGEPTPSVEAPVGDFFGCGFQYKHHTSQYIGMSSGGYYSYFPMPFQKHARIEIVNGSSEEVYAFYYQIGFAATAVDSARAYFHAHWNREILTDPDSNYVALKATGTGQLMGITMNAQSYNGDLGFLEGDEMIYVDGERKPSVHGTGTEDYFTSGWYFSDGEFSAPYHGLVLLDRKYGRVTAYRHHIPDPIPFRQSIKVTFEHGDRNQEPVDMSTVVYWYQKEPHAVQEAILPPQLRQVLTRVLPVGVLPWEKVKVEGSRLLEMRKYGPDWHRGQLMVQMEPEEDIAVEINGLEERHYDLEVFATGGGHYASFTLMQDGNSVTAADTLSSATVPMQGVLLKNVEATNGKIMLKAVAEEEGMIGLDGLRLIPHRHFITDWYLIGPFSNLRKNDYDRAGLDFAYPPEKEIDLDASYGGVDNQPVKWQKYAEGKAGYEMQLRKYFEPSEMVITYALTYIYSPGDQIVPMFIGTDDAAKVFLNEEEVYRFFDLYRIAAPDQDRVLLHLKKGWNSLLLKLENNFGGYAFYVRLPDTDGRVVISSDKKK